MKKNNKSKSPGLRQKAEERLKLRTTLAGKDVARNFSTASDTLKLIHEFEVHQIELEMQNQELILAKEQAIIASEKYIELYDFAPMGYFTLSREGEIIQLNISGAKMLGKARSQLINRLFHLFVSDNSKPFFLHFLEKVFDRHEKEICELTLPTNDDTPMYVYITGIVSGNGSNCLITAIDITERKLLESSIVEKMILLHETERAGKIGGWSFNVKTLTQIWTQETFNILEISTTQGEPKVPECIEFVDDSSRLTAESAIVRAIEFGEPFDQEWKVTTAKGNKRWVNAVGKANWVKGKINSVSGSFQDITERKQVEEALQLSEKKYHAIFNNIQDVFYQTDLAGTVLEVSPSIKYYSDFNRDEIVGNPVTNLYYEPKDRDNVLGLLKEKGEFRDYELRLKTKTGELKYVSANARLVLDADGKPNHIDGVIRDITERIKAEKQIQRLNRVYSVLSNINQTIVRNRNKQFLFEEACRIAVENGGFIMAWMGMVNYATNKIDIVASSGITGEYVNNINIYLNNEALNSGPAGMAIKTGKYNFSNNIETDERTFYWRESAMEYGYRSLIALPIIVRGKTIGVYMIYSGEIDFFNEEEIKLLEELAYDISYALEFIESEKQRRRAEDSLVKLKTAIEKSEVSVVITDNNGIIEYANPFFTKLTGYSPDEYIGKTPQILKSSYHPKEFYQEMWNTIKLGKTWEGEFYNCKKNGEMYWENAIISPIVNSNNAVTHFVAIKTDITHAKNINSELIIAKEHAEESDRLKSAFLANMSHEIRTPMNGILGFTELLKEPDLPDDQQKYYISIIEKSGARLLNIINDIIDISKIESGLMKVKYSEINVNEYLDQVLNFFKPEAETKNIKLTCKTGLPFDEAFLKTDSEKFYAILINLVKNALKYTETGFVDFGYNRVETLHATSLNATSLPNHSYLQFYVKDTGIGIPKDRQEAIFERFVQADIVDKMARQGAGLGLSISKAYVEMLKGKIGLESEEGIGSIFYFTLPYFSDQKEKVVVKSGVQAIVEDNTVGNLKILIAEDDESSSEFISICVREFGKESITVQNGIDAVEACRNNPDIDLVLMDIQMPELNGYDATRQIRQFNTEVKIIALTAFALTGDREKAIEAGCNDYISKPIQMSELVGMIKKYFKRCDDGK